MRIIGRSVGDIRKSRVRTKSEKMDESLKGRRSFVLPSKEPPKNYLRAAENFIAKIRKKHRISAYEQAQIVIQLFTNLISDQSWKSSCEIFSSLNAWKEKIIQFSYPHAMVADNVARRIVSIVTDEYNSMKHLIESMEVEPGSLQKILIGKHRLRKLSSDPSSCGGISKGDGGANQFAETLRENMLASVYDYMKEMESCSDKIARLSIEYIYSNESVMTYGYSRIVERFFKHVSQKRQFSVFVAEAAPGKSGWKMADCLSRTSNITVTLITDSAIFACLGRVTKAIISSFAVSAEGSALTVSGVNNLAIACQHYNIPLLVCCQTYKLSPLLFSQFLLMGDHGHRHSMPSNPQEIWPEKALDQNEDERKYHQHNPQFDIVPSKLVSMVLMPFGGQAPSYLFRCSSELYRNQEGLEKGSNKT